MDDNHEIRPPMTHELKTWPRYFRDVDMGVKRFEIRRGDRDFRVGDTLVLREYDPDRFGGVYSGRECRVHVDYVTSLRPLFDAVGMGITLIEEGEIEEEGDGS